MKKAWYFVSEGSPFILGGLIALWMHTYSEHPAMSLGPNLPPSGLRYLMIALIVCCLGGLILVAKAYRRH